MILNIVLIVIVVICLVIAGIVLWAATQPKEFRAERSLDIDAPAPKIISILEDLKLQRQWSTWDQMDPDMQRDYSGADRGVSAVYEWKSKKMGAGRQEIVGVTPNSRVDIKIDFFKPFRASNKTAFLLKPASKGTNVTWAMSGPASLFHRIIGIVFCSTRMVEKEFEKGLLQLKTLAER
jgi:hypothetical protein